MNTNQISNLLLENYDVFIKDHDTLFEDAVSTAAVITDDSYFELYVDKLTDGIEESIVKTLKPMLEREREMYLEEAGSILTSPQAIAYAVASFPMLINIYAEPLLSKVVTVFPTDKPTMSIPRLTWVAKVIDINGAATEVQFPTARDMVRPDYKKIETVAQNDNIFTLLTTVAGTPINKADFRLSKRNFRLYSVQAAVDVNAAVEVVVSAQADARGNIVATIADIPNATGDEFKIQGQVDFETGSITWSVIPTVASSGLTTVFSDASVKLRVFGNGNGRGVVKSFPRQEIIDIDADIEDSFEVENLEEVIQDWKALYDVNILAELKNHVKDQIKLNRDFEIADLLEGNIETAKKFGQFISLDLGAFIGADKARPTTVQDIFKNVVPTVMSLVERMRRQNNMDVEYIVCGIDVSVVLKSLQEFAIKMDGMSGGTGMSGTTGDFAKLEIIASYAVAEDLLHLVTGAATLGQSSLVEVLYKPLYIITETTNSIRRTFIKSRTWIGVVRPEGIGTIQLSGYTDYMGTYVVA